MAKIVFFELEKFGLGNKKEYIKECLAGRDVSFVEEPLTKYTAHLAKDANVIACFIYSQISKDLLSELKNLRLLVTMSTGFDHIDLKEYAKSGVAVCNVPNYGEHTVAEAAIGLLLALTRKIVKSVERTRKGDFSLEGLRGVDLFGKTIGIVGLGRIGKNVALYAKAFGMRLIAYDRFEDAEFAKKSGVKYVSFEDLLRESDVISLHVPESRETHHLINKENIRNVKKGCFLINTARGKVVETAALVIGINEKILAGVGLDVLEEECKVGEEIQLLHEDFQKSCDLKTLVLEHALLKMDNVIITPHNAFNTDEALMRILETSIDNIVAFLSGVPKNVVKG